MEDKSSTYLEWFVPGSQYSIQRTIRECQQPGGCIVSEIEWRVKDQVGNSMAVPAGIRKHEQAIARWLLEGWPVAKPVKPTVNNLYLSPAQIALTLADLKAARLLSGEDPEKGHGEADAALVHLVRALGLNEIADEFERVGKFYA